MSRASGDMRLFMVLGLGVMLLLSLIRAQASASPCGEAEGRVEQYAYRSRVLGAMLTYSIYLPPCYHAPDRAGLRYPTLYLMHGSDAADSAYWLRLGLAEALNTGIANRDFPPMLVVLPYGDWLANQNQFGAVSWSNVVISDLLPGVEAQFRADPQRDSRAIGGISRGGFWAFNIAFQRPDLFAAVGGHSPFFWPEHDPRGNPLNMAETKPGIETLRIWLDHGPDDYAAPNILRMHTRLDQRGVIHTYMVYPDGAHNQKYWASHIADYLLFYATGWPWRPDATPTPTPHTP